MNDTFSTFKRFSLPEQAKELEELLEQNNIEVMHSDNVPAVDVTFSGSTMLNLYDVKIKESDFPEATKLLNQLAEKQLEMVEPDYYLFDMSDEELKEILEKYDEWSEFDYLLAQKILRERGIDFDIQQIEKIKKQRNEQLSLPEKNQDAWVFFGYAGSFLGGILGILIGYSIMTARKTLPNGEKVFAYSEHDRRQGKTMFIIGLIIFPILFLIQLIQHYKY